MSTCTWLNLAVGISIFSTVVLGCLVTLARLQAAHSLPQATISAARPGQTKRAATSRRVAHCPMWESSCTCWKTARLWEAGTSGLRALVEVSHHRWAPCYTIISNGRLVLLVSTSCVSWQVSWSLASSPHLMGPC